MDDVELGFAEERDAAWLSNRYFPSKLGGQPAWLELKELPSTQELQCNKCQDQKSFLCQLYASYNDDHNFHRSIYMFVCRNKSCQEANQADAITVLRSQLSLKNAYYSEEEPLEDGEALPPIPSPKKLCAACGCHAPHACSRCKAVHYCSSGHQRAHWAQHKATCGSTITTEAYKPLAEIEFPEFEIVMEANPEESNAEPGKDEKERLAEFKQLEAQGKTGDLSNVSEAEMDKYFGQTAMTVDDKIFRHFKKQISLEPEQIIRYQRGGNPLWITNVAETVESQLEIEQCPNCGGERQFEFQIMPQMLTLLKDEQLDWGILAVYTCSKSCPIQGYVKEYVIKQDILETQE
ncbi:programmed cell death protein 2 [Drosophila tropicalis]|uniref:programmed cell death protein 2 n=1 Tax=Drosophila tropicalis TaxID=46794 RepID=UPI0035ABE7C0